MVSSSSYCILRQADSFYFFFWCRSSFRLSEAALHSNIFVDRWLPSTQPCPFKHSFYFLPSPRFGEKTQKNLSFFSPSGRRLHFPPVATVFSFAPLLSPGRVFHGFFVFPVCAVVALRGALFFLMAFSPRVDVLLYLLADCTYVFWELLRLNPLFERLKPLP